MSASQPPLPALPPGPSTNDTAIDAPVVAVKPAADRPLRKAPPALPPALTAAPNLPALLTALQRRWLLAASLAVLAAAGAGSLTWFVLAPARYYAAALLHVSSTPQQVVFNSTRPEPDFGAYQRTQIALLKTRFVLNAALRQPRVGELSIVREQAEPLEWLAKVIDVDFALSPEMMRISMKGDKPEEIAILVNAVTDAYLEEVVNKEQRRRQAHEDTLKKIYTERETRLKARRQTLRNLAENAGSGDPHTLQLKHRFAMEQLALARKELLQLQSDLRRAKIELAAQEERDQAAAPGPARPSGPPVAALEPIFRQDEGYRKLLAKAAELDKHVRHARVIAVGGENSQAVQDLRKQHKQAQNDLAERRKELFPEAVKIYEAQNQGGPDLSKDRLQHKLVVFQKLEDSLREEVGQLVEDTRSIGTQNLEIEALRDEIALTESLSRSVGAELEKWKVEMQAPPRVAEQERAVAPKTKDVKTQMRLTAAASVCSFMLVLLGVAFVEHRTRRITSPDDVAHGLGLRLVGTVPSLPGNDRREALAPSARNRARMTQVAESVNAARTMLMHAARGGGMRVLMVSSAMPGEGKTSVATQLALSLARAGYRTLLVDCDLRKPAVHSLFGLPLEGGFSEVLRHEIELDDAVRPTRAANLSVVSAGRCDGVALEALSQESVRGLFVRLRQQFDVVVVDSAPVLCVADSMLLSQHVDGVVLSVMRNVSRLHTVHAACERLEGLGIHMIGAVVSGVSAEAYGAPYYVSNIPDDLGR